MNNPTTPRDHYTLIKHKCGHRVEYVTRYKLSRIQVEVMRDCICAKCRIKELMEEEDAE